MAPNPANSVHNDAWQTDAYTQFAGPRGRRPQAFSNGIGRTCITLVFDRQGRLIGSCTNLDQGPALYLLDPVTLDTLAFMQLPFVPPPAGTNPALNTTGGAYFYLDNRGRVVVAASNRHILVVKTTDGAGGPAFQQVADYDPTRCLPGGRAAAVDPARRQGPALVRRPHARHGRRARSQDGKVRLDRPQRGDRELLRDCQRRHLRRDRPGDVQVPRRGRSQAEGDLASALPQHRQAEGRADQRGVGHHADAHRALRQADRGPRARRSSSRSPTTRTR